MRVVLDTNQHISAIIRPNGNPAQIVQLWHIGLIELAISPSILEEFAAVVHRPRIQKNTICQITISLNILKYSERLLFWFPEQLLSMLFLTIQTITLSLPVQ